MSQDRITLTVPAKGEYAKTVRMTAAALSSRLGMTYDEVDDVRMAAEEAFVYAVDTVPDDAEVVFTFFLNEETLSMQVCLGDAPDVSDEEVERRTSYATFILEAVCDRFELVSEANGKRVLKLTKSAGSVEGV